MNRNDYFGQRRALENRIEDFGYSDMAFATGDQDRIKTLRTQLDTKNDELAKVNSEYALLNTNLTNGIRILAEREERVKHICEWNWGKERCRKSKQAWTDQWITPLRNQNTETQSNIDAKRAQINGINLEISQITQEIATLLETQKLEGQSNLTLAQQGKTAEQIRLDAQAQANAIANQSRVDSEMKERKSKSRKIIILSIILSAVFLTGLFVFYKIKKMKKA
jgi:hypothetical protein